MTDNGTTRQAVAKTSDPVIIHTDGSCLSNPGPGGWAAILCWQGNEREISGAEPDSTNNRMELTAAINGLNAVTRPMTIDLYTDSKYVMTGVTDWMPRWKANGWKTAAKKPVKNQDLWIRLDEQSSRHRIEWCWVKGHSGHPENERADTLANRGLDRLRSGRRG